MQPSVPKPSSLQHANSGKSFLKMSLKDCKNITYLKYLFFDVLFQLNIKKIISGHMFLWTRSDVKNSPLEFIQSFYIHLYNLNTILNLNLLTSYIYGSPSKNRNLTSYIYIYIYMDEIFTGDFASWTVHFVNICVKNQQIHQLFIQFINNVW
jgi:hypothetical protein